MKRHGGVFEARSVAPAFPIRMLALDLDGTLVHETRVIPERTRLAVRAALDAGVRVSVITGRMPTSGLRFAAQMRLVDPIVGYQGAVVREIRGAGDERPGRLLYHEPISSEGALAAVRWAYANGLAAHVNHLERFIIQRDDPRWAEYQAFLGALAHPVDDLFVVLRRPVSKVTAVGDPPLPESLIGAARAAIGHLAQPTISHPRFLEFVAPGVSKGRALRWLARRQGIALEQVMAIGDQLNDLEMVAAAGHGVAMTNAPLELKRLARYVAPSVFDEGAAEIIEALVLASAADARVNATRFAAERHLADLPGPADAAVQAAQAAAAASSAGPRATAPLSEPGALPEPLAEIAVTTRLIADGAAGRAESVAVLRAGGIVAIPTDTVYGIAVDLAADGGIERLFAAKDRPPEKGIVLLLSDAAQAGEIGEVGPAAAALAEAFWPGGLTLILPRRPGVALPVALTGGASTIGLRVPDHPAPRALAAALGPLPTTSANRSGQPDAQSAADVVGGLGDAVDLVLDGGPSSGGRPSTVVDCSGPAPRILRAGAIAAERLREVLAAVGIALPSQADQ